MARCFVIQPFDAGIYDSRYKDVFRPAIAAANLEAYRVDKDPSVSVPIADIEDGIKNADICFADISTNNPNVWYELGFAFACGKEVVMVSCVKERTGKFPFDIQHRSVINYTLDSKNDFEELEKQISEKLLAYLKTQKTMKRLSVVPLADQEGLSSHEITMLLIVLTETVGSTEGVSTYRLKQEMQNAGFTDAATAVGIMTLKEKGMIRSESAEDYNGNQCMEVWLEPRGQQWILSNQDKLEFRIKSKKDDQGEEIVTLDDLPF